MGGVKGRSRQDAVRGPEIYRANSRSSRHRFQRALHVIRDRPRAAKEMVSMPLTVKCNLMSPSSDLLCYIWICFCHRTEKEKCGVDSQAVKLIENKGSRGWVRAVIEGEREAIDPAFPQ